MCERCLPIASARRCSTSPAARITTSRCASGRLRMGLTLNEYGLFRLDDERACGGRDGGGEYTQRSGWPGFRRNCVRTAARSKRRRNGGCRVWWKHRTSAAISTCTRRRPTAARHWRKWQQRRAALGYEYIAITDHSKALAMANGLDEARVVAFAQSRSGRRNADGLPLRVFSGIECDILKDGDDGSRERCAGGTGHR